MVTNATLTYFKQQGFTAVVMVVPDSQTYQTQLTTIKSNNMLPIIDIEMPIWDGGQLQSTPISNFSGYFQSLKTAGWQYVASEGGRSGDLEYLAHYFKGYVNFNCDQCGLWEGGYPVYTNPFTVANSWESYYPSEWPYIQNGSKQAAALGIQNGILAGTWANSGGDNQIYANSVSGSGTPSYLSMLNWSYANGIGFTSFHVWCGDSPNGLSQYQSLGFDKLVAAMQVYYPATTSASFAKGQPTQLSLSASSTTPAVNQSVTFTATLSNGTTPLSGENATIYHLLNGVRYNDTTNTTNTTGQIAVTTSFGSPGTRSYYATFAGDGSYQTSTSSVVTVNVKAQTKVTLTASNSTPAVNQSVTFTATLSNGTTPLSGENATIYHLLNGVRYNDTTNTTNTTGQIAVTTSFGSPGTRSYYATFAGDGSYQTSTSSVVTVNVTNVTKMPTTLTLTASNSTPAVNQQVTFNATLSNGTTPLSGENATIYHLLNGVRYNDTTNTTNTTGQIAVTTSFGSPGTRSYYATFAGDGSYQTSTSSVVTVNVDAQTNIALTASNTTPAVNQSVTFNATLSWWNPATGKWVAVTTSGEPIQVWHTLNGVRYNDTTINTNGSSTATFTQKWTSAGTRYYYATFAGDTWYNASTSAVVTMTVH